MRKYNEANDRNIRVTLPALAKRTGRNQERAYKLPESAAAAALRWMLLNGKLGQRAVIWHAKTGLELGVIKCRLNSGRLVISTDLIWERE